MNINVLNDIKNPEELLKYMEENIEYGFCDLDGNKYRDNNKDFNKKCDELWRLSNPERLLKNKMGICWDQVELERAWFLKHNYEIKTIFIGFLNTNLPTHTYLVYKDSDKWYWFEHSDFQNKGIHEFETIDDLIKEQIKRHIEYIKEINLFENVLLNNLYICEYYDLPYNINSNEFFSYIINNGKDITNIFL